MKTLWGFLDSQQDPDEACQAEYRACYELLAGIAEGGDDSTVKNDFDLAEGILSELIAHATAMRYALAGYLAGA